MIRIFNIIYEYFIVNDFLLYNIIYKWMIFDNWTVKQPLLLLLERRWSSRTFRYGYLVTTSPQSLAPPSAAPSLRLGHWLRAYPTPMVWRAVCTKPGNVFTATCWFAITSNSNFVQASCSLQSELGRLLWDLLHLAVSLPFVFAIVVRV